MHIEELREYCLNKRDTDESFPFGADTLVFKTNGKMFLLVSLNSFPLQFNVKCEPGKAVWLREEYPDTILPGYHMNKKYWNTVILKRNLSRLLLCEMIDDSYNLVCHKRNRTA